MFRKFSAAFVFSCLFSTVVGHSTHSADASRTEALLLKKNCSLLPSPLDNFPDGEFEARFDNFGRGILKSGHFTAYLVRVSGEPADKTLHDQFLEHLSLMCEHHIAKPLREQGASEKEIQLHQAVFWSELYMDLAINAFREEVQRTEGEEGVEYTLLVHDDDADETPATFQETVKLTQTVAIEQLHTLPVPIVNLAYIVDVARSLNSPRMFMVTDLFIPESTKIDILCSREKIDRKATAELNDGFTLNHIGAYPAIRYLMTYPQSLDLDPVVLPLGVNKSVTELVSAIRTQLVARKEAARLLLQWKKESTEHATDRENNDGYSPIGGLALRITDVVRYWKRLGEAVDTVLDQDEAMYFLARALLNDSEFVRSVGRFILVGQDEGQPDRFVYAPYKASIEFRHRGSKDLEKLEGRPQEVWKFVQMMHSVNRMNNFFLDARTVAKAQEFKLFHDEEELIKKGLWEFEHASELTPQAILSYVRLFIDLGQAMLKTKESRSREELRLIRKMFKQDGDGVRALMDFTKDPYATFEEYSQAVQRLDGGVLAPTLPESLDTLLPVNPTEEFESAFLQQFADFWTGVKHYPAVVDAADGVALTGEQILKSLLFDNLPAEDGEDEEESKRDALTEALASKKQLKKIRAGRHDDFSPEEQAFITTQVDHHKEFFTKLVQNSSPTFQNAEKFDHFLTFFDISLAEQRRQACENALLRGVLSLAQNLALVLRWQRGEDAADSWSQLLKRANADADSDEVMFGQSK